MNKYEVLMYPNSVYHIYNHANGKENLFHNTNNYHFFLKKYDYYIEPIAKTFAYCLMPNHLHLMVQIKDETDIQKANVYFKINKQEKLENIEPLTEDKIPIFISKTFGNLFSSYAQSFNKQQSRKGNLFASNFKRRRVSDISYFSKLLFYIHNNPVRHGFVENMEDWLFSSYNTFLIEKKTKIAKQEVMEWFGDLIEFKKFHNSKKVDFGFEF